MSQSILHYEQGKICYQNKKFEDAIVQFTEALRLKPETNQHKARCYNARGVVFFYLGEFKKVIKDCTQAIELDGENANYFNCRGNAYFSLAKFEEAADDFSKAIEKSPEVSHGRYFNNRGSAYRRLKHFREAIDDYSKAINVDQKNGNYYNNRGNTYFDMGEFQLAINDFTTALGLEPYSPKTKLTLAQAHEALAQEKRMKNTSEYQGVYSSMKKEAKTERRKDRAASIFVSPGGVEAIFIRGWLKKKESASYEWSEDMKIELVDETHVKLYLDNRHRSWVIITPCEGASVEEELIGRITTKFASYSTACLVAQHESVVNEYTEILRHVKEARQELEALKEVHSDAVKQRDEFVKSEKYDAAEKSKTNLVSLQKHISEIEVRISSEQARAETVRARAEQEAGPVLDMVLIMQNRVRELYQSRVKDNSGKYRVEDLELEEQLTKMKLLVDRARDLQMVVSKPVNELQQNFEQIKEKEYDDNDEESGEEEEDDGEQAAPSGEVAAAFAAAPAAAAAAAVAAPAPVREAKVEAAPAKSIEELKDEEENWDDMDEDESMKGKFAVGGNEIMMSMMIEQGPGGMMTIRPQAGGLQKDNSKHDVVVNAEQLALMEEQKKAIGQLSEDQKRSHAEAQAARAELSKMAKEREAYEASTEAERRKNEQLLAELTAIKTAAGSLSSEQSAQLAKVQALETERLAKQKELEDKENKLASLMETNQSLSALRAQSEKMAQDLAAQLDALKSRSNELSQEKEMTAREKQDLADAVRQQQQETQTLSATLASVNQALAMKAQEAEEKRTEVMKMAEKGAALEALVEQMKNSAASDRVKEEQMKKEFDAQMVSLQRAKEEVNGKLDALSAEKAALQNQVEEQRMSMAEMMRHLKEMQQQIAKENEAKAKLEEARRKDQEEMQMKLMSIEEQKKAMEAQAKAKAIELEKERANRAQLEAANKEKESELEEERKLVKEQKEIMRQEELKRRQLHNLIQEIKGNIRVYIRVRPDLQGKNSYKNLFEDIVGSDQKGIRIRGPPEKSATGSAGLSQKKWEFEFDRIFWDRASQKEVFDEISGLVQSALDGYRVSIFAYGQTGSGKTFTMEGPENITDDTRGVIPRSVEQIFSYRDSDEMKKRGWVYECQVSFLEIYVAEIRDLLSGEPPGENKHDIKLVKEGKETKTVVEGLTWETVRNAADLKPVLAKAKGARSTAATSSNERSSRSHSVFTMAITGVHKDSGSKSFGVLNLVDLAGSERIDKSKVEGQRLEETKAINFSLTCLGDVIAAIASSAKHVPFRNSKLTYLLQDSFGGGSKTLMFINCSGEEEHLQETLCSLRFGAKVYDCHIGQGKKAISSGEEASSPSAAGAAAGDKKKKKAK